MHRIWLDSKREDFGGGAEYYDCDISSIASIRKSVDVFGRTSSTKDVLMVDVSFFSFGNFVVFLKLLENVYVRGSVWFYGSRVFSAYPPTLRSRCAVIRRVFDIKSEGVQEFLNEHLGAAQFEREFEYLSAYTLRFAWSMINAREKFLTFMYHLEHCSKDNFYTIFSPIDELDNPFCVHLFYEWLKDERENVLFSSKELRICQFLRGKKFGKVMHLFMLDTRLLAEYLFPFLISYKMEKVLG